MAPCRKRPTTTHTIEPAAAATTRPSTNVPMHTMNGSAGPRRSTIEFVTPDRVTYRPELGVLYPSELDTGMRIYVEYDRSDPNLVRVQGRSARLAIIPALSVAVVSWAVAAAALSGLSLLERRLTRRSGVR